MSFEKILWHLPPVFEEEPQGAPKAVVEIPLVYPGQTGQMNGNAAVALHG